MRVDREGTRSFFSNSHVGTHILGMHNHVDYDRTMGLGEMNIVMNGVDFKTRHNDYKLSMPSKTSTGYDETQYIDYPPVPPAVLAKATVEVRQSVVGNRSVWTFCDILYYITGLES